MKKSDFKVEFDQKQEIWYVIKTTDELTKNHKEIGNIVSGLMPENRDDHLCPVRSFRMYLEHLNLENDFLWQTPLQSINFLNPNVWFSKQHQGKNTLGKFMTQVSLNCKLSKMYTNHSICVTGITVLTRLDFTPSEIMSVSGHKSVQSLSNYQRTQPKQKLTMGKALYQSMTRKEEEIDARRQGTLPATTEQRAIQYDHKKQFSANAHKPLETKNVVPSNAIVPFQPNFKDEVPDFDLVSLLDDIEHSQNTRKNNSVAVTSNNNMVNNTPSTMFSNCKFENVTFNFTK